MIGDWVKQLRSALLLDKELAEQTTVDITKVDSFLSDGLQSSFPGLFHYEENLPQLESEIDEEAPVGRSRTAL
jgi:hypothetical protein